MKKNVNGKKIIRVGNLLIAIILCLAVCMAGCGAPSAPETATEGAATTAAATTAAATEAATTSAVTTVVAMPDSSSVDAYIDIWGTDEDTASPATTATETWATTEVTTTTAATWPADEATTTRTASATTTVPATEAATEAATTAAATPGDQSFLDDIYGDSAATPDNSTLPQVNNEKYIEIIENKVVPVSSQSMFTFSLKVDTASYNNVQRYIESGYRPPADAVKIEEMINYFSYDDAPQFNEGEPFAISAEIGQSPFGANRYLAYVRVKARDIDPAQLPPCNFTFLIDSSGSMSSYDKLPLLKTSFGLLVDSLTANDMVSIVTYAGSSRIVLDSVSGADKDRIMNAINSLEAGGSTAGGEGIKTAYQLAEKNYRPNGNNRIIMATDGDFNVGVSSPSELERLISQKRESGIYLSILGYGMGNYRDDTMETLAKNGNGNASYINSVATAKKVLVEELASNLYVIADDVKAQIELNPENIRNYRLIGYENRALENKDFKDDTKDAGEIGVGSDIVLLFEFDLNYDNNAVDSDYKYSNPGTGGDTAAADGLASRQSGMDYSDELFEIRLRFKRPGESESRQMTYPVGVGELNRNYNSDDFRFASAVASFGHLLRGSSYIGRVTIDSIISDAQNSLGRDPQGYRYEFIRLLMDYKRL